MAGMLALGASLDLLLGLDMEIVSAAVLDITDRACERLGKIGATIVSDRRPDHRGGRAAIWNRRLRARRPRSVGREKALPFTHSVVLSCRAGRLRISPHAYNNEEDLDRLIDALQSFSP